MDAVWYSKSLSKCSCWITKEFYYLQGHCIYFTVREIKLDITENAFYTQLGKYKILK